MKNKLKIILRVISFFGFNPLILYHNIATLPLFIREYFIFKGKDKPPKIPIKNFNLCLSDRYSESGNIAKHYFFQDLIVAQKIFANKPIKHVDIGSRIDGFVAHIATFRPVEVFDIRPLEKNIPNMVFNQIDMTQFDQKYFQYTDSVSCLHALEHFGLGRYGDRIDSDGHLKGFDFIKKMLKPGGLFYLSVPIGKLHVEFNAHRVFSIEYILNWVSKDFIIERVDIIDDSENVFYDVHLTDNFFNVKYGCGIFTLRKLALK